MNFFDAYLRFGPDTEAIAEALGIKPHEADTLINLHMETEHQRRISKPAKLSRPDGKIRHAGYDRKEAMGVNGGRYD